MLVVEQDLSNDRVPNMTLELTGVRVERLQDVSEADAMAEGVRLMRDGSGVWVGREGPDRRVTPWLTAREAFTDIWESINGSGSWDANPWVWVLEFKVHRCNVDDLMRRRTAVTDDRVQSSR